VASTEELTALPDLVLCDLTLPEGCRQGGDAIEWLADRGAAVIAFSQLASARAQLAAVAAGANGFVHKAAEPEQVVSAIDVVADGGHWVGPQLAGWLLQDVRSHVAPGSRERARRHETILRAVAQGDTLTEFEAQHRLRPGTGSVTLADAIAAYRARSRQYQPSPRERQVIDCIAVLGMTAPEAAAHLGVSERTVRTHLESIKEKYRWVDPAAHQRLTPKMAAHLWAQHWDGTSTNGSRPLTAQE
jgi:DNA-binding NarL/FixJ family response regulator